MPPARPPKRYARSPAASTVQVWSSRGAGPESGRILVQVARVSAALVTAVGVGWGAEVGAVVGPSVGAIVAAGAVVGASVGAPDVGVGLVGLGVAIASVADAIVGGAIASEAAGLGAAGLAAPPMEHPAAAATSSRAHNADRRFSTRAVWLRLMTAP